MVWKCNSCGYTLDAEKPPEKCPSCKEGCNFVDATCAIPRIAGDQVGVSILMFIGKRRIKKWN